MEILKNSKIHSLQIVLKCSTGVFLSSPAPTQMCSLSTNYNFHTRVLTESVVTFNLKYLVHEKPDSHFVKP